MKQKFTDKNKILKKLSTSNKVVVELGAGKRKREGAINIDILNLPEVDIVANIEEGLTFLPDNSVDEIHSKSFLEHIDSLDLVLKEMHRVVKPRGEIHTFVPHFSNPYYYSDPTHKRFFGLYTFYYYAADQTGVYRQVPAFYNNAKFDIKSIKLNFHSPFVIIKYPLKLFGWFINKKIIFQEFYEGVLSPIIPCYGMYIVMSPAKE